MDGPHDVTLYADALSGLQVGDASAVIVNTCDVTKTTALIVISIVLTRGKGHIST